ncbi:MAG TPA: hypothetical protein VJS44_10140 [Pyrinomonadaceae bacterium]|nr:hypothetical protein [Pyrinomonadaceae bacterium]
MKKKLTAVLLTLTGLMILAAQVSGGSSAATVTDQNNPHYKGGSTFNLVGAGPNVARCGAFPENIELSFEGSGIDTEGGYNTAVFSACTNTTTNLVFDLKATDTYVQTGDQVFIEGDPFVLAPNPAICAAANAHGVPFRVTGGTGGHAGATGQGHFNIASNLTPCNGQVLPSQVWFEGGIRVPQ